MKKKTTATNGPEISIVRKIRLPENGRITRGSKYPVADLQVGDALVTTKAHARNVIVAARNYAKRHGWHFITRTIEDGKMAIKRTV
jgi:hypothetical protein